MFDDDLKASFAEHRERQDAALRLQLDRIPEYLWPFVVAEHPPPTVDREASRDVKDNTVTITTTTPVPRARVEMTRSQLDQWNNLRSVVGTPKLDESDLEPFWRIIEDQARSDCWHSCCDERRNPNHGHEVDPDQCEPCLRINGYDMHKRQSVEP